MPPESDDLTGREFCELTGIHRFQLAYCVREKWIVPSAKGEQEKLPRHYFHRSDVDRVKKLIDAQAASKKRGGIPWRILFAGSVSPSSPQPGPLPCPATGGSVSFETPNPEV